MAETPKVCKHCGKERDVVTVESEERPDTSHPDSPPVSTSVDRMSTASTSETQRTFETKPISWDSPNDQNNPLNWPKSKKWVVTAIDSLITVNITYASVAPVVDTLRITSYFQVPEIAGYLITSMFLFGYVVGPIIWGPASEIMGRRAVLLIAFTLYLLTFVGQALAQNIETLLIMRFFGGVFGSAPLAAGGGIIVDLWDVRDRAVPSTVYLTSVIIGPSIATIAGGFMTQHRLSWRWPLWVTTIYSGICLLTLYFFLPETNGEVLLLWKARELRKADPVANKDVYAEHERGDWSLGGVILRTASRPIEMLFKEKILVLVTIYLSIVYGVLYGLFEALPFVFVKRRHFSAQDFGLIYVAVAVGIILGGVIYVWLSRNIAELVEKWEGSPPPENQLTGAIIAGPLLVIGCFWLGWTGEYSRVPWYVPMLSTVLIGCGVNLTFASLLNYLASTYRAYTASAFAITTIFRCAVGGAFPLFTTAMFDGMGANWACTLLGLVFLLLCPIPIVFRKYGAQLRRDSHFAPGLDIILAAKLKEKEMASIDV